MKIKFTPGADDTSGGPSSAVSETILRIRKTRIEPERDVCDARAWEYVCFVIEWRSLCGGDAAAARHLAGVSLDQFRRYRVNELQVRSGGKQKKKNVPFTTKQAGAFEMKIDHLLDKLEGVNRLFTSVELKPKKADAPAYQISWFISVHLRDCSRDHNVVQLLSLGDALPMEVTGRDRQQWLHQTVVHSRFSDKGEAVAKENVEAYLRPNMRGRTIFQPSSTPFSGQSSG